MYTKTLKTRTIYSTKDCTIKKGILIAVGVTFRYTTGRVRSLKGCEVRFSNYPGYFS